MNSILEFFGSGRQIEAVLNIVPISLDVAQTMPCGLMIDELDIISLIHAFPADFDGNPAVDGNLQPGRLFDFPAVCDNSVGLPPGYDLFVANAQGLQYVGPWATHQQGGILDMVDRHGAVFIMNSLNWVRGKFNGC